jgi:leucyl aminopeptidase
VLVPVVENAIAGDAMRPGDVLATRAGLTVEVGNTDAEGRLILADALTRAAELEPVLTIDMATLTGAARVALGPQVIPFYTPDDDLALEIEEGAREASDPVWRMPLWDGYREAVESDIADLKNDPDAWAQAGSMTAALFLQRFAPTTGAWVHFDIFAWNPKAAAGLRLRRRGPGDPGTVRHAEVALPEGLGMSDPRLTLARDRPGGCRSARPGRRPAL